MAMKVLSVSNQKGGVGKTTTAINLAAGLVYIGKRVLLIDLDPQGSATVLVGVEPEYTVHDVLTGERSLQDVMVDSPEGYSFIPASLKLTSTEVYLGSEIAGESILKQRLEEEVGGEFDYVIIDTPPNFGYLALSALVAADRVIIPVKPARLDVYGLRDMLSTILKVQGRLNRDLRFKVLVTMHDSRKLVSREYTEGLLGPEGVESYETVIRVNTEIEKSQNLGQSVIFYNPNSTGALDYVSLVEEVLTENE